MITDTNQDIANKLSKTFNEVAITRSGQFVIDVKKFNGYDKDGVPVLEELTEQEKALL